MLVKHMDQGKRLCYGVYSKTLSDQTSIKQTSIVELYTIQGETRRLVISNFRCPRFPSLVLGASHSSTIVMFGLVERNTDANNQS